MDRDHIRYAEGQIPQDGWGGFDAYMKKKAAKLADQFDLGASSCSKGDASAIFKGVSIFVNGYTDPPAEKLKRLMMLHGGRFIYYPTKANTTHIIATNLAYTKIKELKNEKVVTPNWITDSVKAGKLLPCAPYLLYRPKASNQTLHRYSIDKKSPSKDRRHECGSKDSRSSPVTCPTPPSSKTETESDTHVIAIQPKDVSTFHPWNKGGISPTSFTASEDHCGVNAERGDPSKDGTVVHPEDEASVKTAGKGMRSDFLPLVETDQKETDNKDTRKVTVGSENLNPSITERKEPTAESCHSHGEKGETKESGKTGFTSGSETVSDTVNEPYAKQKKECQGADDFSQGALPSGKLYFPRSTDPNFLTSFYRHSSFYHLTTWRAEHRLFVKELQRKNEHNGRFPGKEKLIARFGKNRKSVQKVVDETTENASTVPDGSEEVGGTNKDSEWRTDDEDRVIMHIDIDAFFVTVSLLNYPELRGKPVAVAHYAGKPASKSLKHWKQKTLSEKEEGYKNHCREFWSGEYKMGMGSQIVKKESSTDGEDLQEVASEVSSSQAVVQSESENFLSLAAIASCSYEARKAGVRNGMVMKTAKELCPELRTIPYNFEGYYIVSRRLYEIVASYTHDIQAASCDEVILDVTDLMKETGATGSEIAEAMREEIFRKTQCTASAGLAPNVILAKLCTKAAKPDGVYSLTREGIPDFLMKAPVGDLPGIGRAFNKKLQSMGIYTCSDLQGVALKTLQKHFGPKTGQILYENCRGEDTRTPAYEKERKYVSVEVNYGIRFDTDDDAYKFLHRLSGEVHNKLKRLLMQGRTVSLKLKVRRAGTPIEDPKFMGYGIYDNKIRSVSLNMETDNLDTIYRTCRSLLLQMAVTARDIRGVGIQMSRLKKCSSTTCKSKPLTEMLPKKEDCPKPAKVPTSPTSSSETAKKAYSLLSFVTKNSPKSRTSSGSVSGMSSVNSESNASNSGNLKSGRDAYVKKKHLAPLEGIVLDQNCLIKRSQPFLVNKEVMSPTNAREDVNKRRGELSSPDQLGKKVGIDTHCDEERNEEEAKAQRQMKHVAEKFIKVETEDGKSKSVNQVYARSVKNQTGREKQPSSTDISNIEEEILIALNITTRDDAGRVTRDTSYNWAGDPSNRVTIGGSEGAVKPFGKQVGLDKVQQGLTGETKKAPRDNAQKGGDTKIISRDGTHKRQLHSTEKGPMVIGNTGSKGNTKNALTDDTSTGSKGNIKKEQTDYTNTGCKGNTMKRSADKTNSYVKKGYTKKELMEKISKLSPKSDTKVIPEFSKALMSNTKKRLLDNMKKVPLGSTKKTLLYNAKKRLLSHTKKGLVSNTNNGSFNSAKRMYLESAPQRTEGHTKKRLYDVNDRMTRRDNVCTALKPKRPKVNSTKFDKFRRTVDENTHGSGSVQKTSRNVAINGVKGTKEEKRYTVSEATKAKLWAFRRQDNKEERPNLTMVSVGKEGDETVEAPLMQPENEPLENHYNSDKLRKVTDKNGSIKRKGLPRPKRPTEDVGSHAALTREPSAWNEGGEASRKDEDRKEVEETVKAPVMPPENAPSRDLCNSDELRKAGGKNESITRKGLPRPQRLQNEDARSHAAPKRDPSATNVIGETFRRDKGFEEMEETVEAPLIPPGNEPSWNLSNSDELRKTAGKNESTRRKGLPKPHRLQDEDFRSHAAPKRDPSATNVIGETFRRDKGFEEMEETVEAPLIPPGNEPSWNLSNSDELRKTAGKNESTRREGLPRPHRLQDEDFRSHAALKRDSSATNVRGETFRTEKGFKELKEIGEAHLMPPENEPSRNLSNPDELRETVGKNESITRKGLPRSQRLQNEDTGSHASPKRDRSTTNAGGEAFRTDKGVKWSKGVKEIVEAPLLPPENEPSRKLSKSDELRTVVRKSSTKRKGLPRPKQPQNEGDRSGAAPRTDPNVGRGASRVEHTHSHGSGRSDEKSTDSDSKIDPSMLVTLPQDIQKEVIRDHNLDSKDLSDGVASERNAEKFDPNQASTSTGITSKLDQEVLQNLPPDILQEVVANERSRLKLPQDERGSSSRFTDKHSSKTACKRDIREALNIHETSTRKLSSFKIPKLERNTKTGKKIPTEAGGSAYRSRDSSTHRKHSSTSENSVHRDRNAREVRSDESATKTKSGATNEGDIQVKVTENVLPSDENQISLGGACKFVDVREKLKQWTELFDKPIDEDISHVVHFMRSHILDQNLEMVFQLLRAFKRIVSSSRRRRWIDAYYTIKDRVQTTVKHIYGGTLKLSDDLY